jgi:5-formyltetrahydrofolate cyclo-ligase
VTASPELQLEKTALRREKRRLRRSLTAQQRAEADRAIVRHIEALGAFRSARNVATYCAFDGEPDVGALLASNRHRDKRFFAPIITHRDMRFGLIESRASLRRNRFGIAEGPANSIAQPRTLDVVLVPLVAFDSSGARLGMGAGYYDRYFEFLRNRTQYVRPRLVGIAYSCQRVQRLPRAPWDVPLWGSITEIGFDRCGGH